MDGGFEFGLACLFHNASLVQDNFKANSYLRPPPERLGVRR
jgi:hypothetical protein